MSAVTRGIRWVIRGAGSTGDGRYVKNSEKIPSAHKPVSRRPWRRPQLTPLGNLEKIVFGGGGKVSGGNDPGDTRKPSGLG